MPLIICSRLQPTSMLEMRIPVTAYKVAKQTLDLENIPFIFNVYCMGETRIVRCSKINALEHNKLDSNL